MGNGRLTGVTTNTSGTPRNPMQEMPANMAGTRYEELWNNNPWLKMQIEKSGFDKFLNALGFKTATDRSNETLQNNAQLYYSQLIEALGEENYNSAPEQVKRQLMAGVNPDLNNGLDAGEATEIDNQATDSGITGTQTIEEVQKTVQKGIEIGINAIGLINGGFKAVMDGIKNFEEINTMMGGRDKQIVESVNSMFDDLIDKDGDLYIPGIGVIGRKNKVNEDGNDEDTLDSVTVVPTLTYKEWLRNPYVRSRFRTKREATVAWHQLEVRRNSYRPNLSAVNKDKQYFASEETIGKIQAIGENREEVKKFYQMVYKTDRDIHLAINQFQEDYYKEINGTSTGYRDENGNWVKKETPSLGTLKGRLERQQQTLDSSVINLETKVMQTYENLMIEIDQSIANSNSIIEKNFWIMVQDTIFNHIQRSKSGNNVTIGDLIKSSIGASRESYEAPFEVQRTEETTPENVYQTYYNY